MNSQVFLPLITIGLLLSGFAPTFASSVEKLVQVPNRDTAPLQDSITRIRFKPSSGSGQPPSTRGAGSRSNLRCPQDTADSTDTSLPTLTALVPATNSGLTLAERPTFWVYVPKTSARQIILSLREEGGSPHSQRFFPIAGASNIISVQPTSDSPPLEVGKSYQWAIVLVCGDRPSPNDPVVTAWVRRVGSPQPSKQQGMERAAWYGEQGIWYDALTTLATIRRSQPNNPAFTKIWVDFLTQPGVGLDTIANESLGS